jgi:type II secretory pathway pseudopilin PulG
MNDKRSTRPRTMSDLLSGRQGLSLVEFLVVLGVIVVLIAFLLPPVTRGSRPAARRTVCKNNLKQIGLALHRYESKYGVLPPAYITDDRGKPLHSWRTLILPQFQDPRLDELYRSIDMSRPWDDPVNAKAAQTPVAVYHCLEAAGAGNLATYVALLGDDSCLRTKLPRKMADITDGTSNTIMLVEVPVEQAVPWMSTEDMSDASLYGIGPKSRLPHSGGIHVCLADGTIRFISASLDMQTRRSLVTASANDQLPEF